MMRNKISINYDAYKAWFWENITSGAWGLDRDQQVFQRGLPTQGRDGVEYVPVEWGMATVASIPTQFVTDGLIRAIT